MELEGGVGLDPQGDLVVGVPWGQEGLQDPTHLGGLVVAPEMAEAYGWAIQEVWEDLADSLLELLASGEGGDDQVPAVWPPSSTACQRKWVPWDHRSQAAKECLVALSLLPPRSKQFGQGLSLSLNTLWGVQSWGLGLTV